jgi:hypothetical protein
MILDPISSVVANKILQADKGHFIDDFDKLGVLEMQVAFFVNRCLGLVLDLSSLFLKIFSI